MAALSVKSSIGKLREITREHHTKGGGTSARGGERKFLFLRPSLARSPVLRSGDRHRWSTYTQAEIGLKINDGMKNCRIGLLAFKKLYDYQEIF